MAQKEPQPVKKMNIKSIGCDAKEAIRKNAQVFMARIGGEVTDVVSKEARNGDPYSYFVGEFQAIRFDGAVFTSDILFLPGFLFEKIEGQLKSSGGKTVQFAYDLFSTPDESASHGYAYSAAAVVKSEAVERLNDFVKTWEKPMPGTEPEKKGSKKG